VPIDEALTRLFTGTTPARPVAVCRIGIGLAAIGKGLVVTAVLAQLAFDPRSVHAPAFAWSPQLDRVWEIAVFAALWLAAAGGLTLGWRARACAAVLFGCSVLTFGLDQNLRSNHGYLLMLLTLLLSFTDSGAVLSVGWKREGRPEREIERWPVLLMRLQLSIVYFYTALAKVNPVFLSGTVIAQVAYFPPFLRRPGAMALLAAGTIAVEFFLAFALWIRVLRPWAFLAGFLLHGLIAALMGAALWVFSLITFSLYVLFLDAPPHSRLVIWDDRCGFCRRWIRLARRLDWLRLHRFEGSSRTAALAEAGVTREEAGEEVKLWDGRRRYGGFDAVRVLLEQTPAGFLWARLLALPIVRPIGVRAYRAVARRRRGGPQPLAPV